MQYEIKTIQRTVESTRRTVEFRVDGKLHRLRGPAIVYDDGAKFWFMWGKLHRTSGPAEIESDGTERYWVFGEEITKEEFDERYGGGENDVHLINGQFVSFDEYDNLAKEFEPPFDQL